MQEDPACHSSYSALTDTACSFWHVHLPLSKLKEPWISRLICGAYPQPSSVSLNEATPVQMLLQGVLWKTHLGEGSSGCWAGWGWVRPSRHISHGARYLGGRGGEVCGDLTCNTCLGKRWPAQEISDKHELGNKSPDRIISAVIDNLSLSAQQPHLIYCGWGASVFTGGETWQILPTNEHDPHMSHPRSALTKGRTVLQQNSSPLTQSSMSEIIFSGHFRHDSFIIWFIRTVFRVTRNDPYGFALPVCDPKRKYISLVSSLSVFPTVAFSIDVT